MERLEKRINIIASVSGIILGIIGFLFKAIDFSLGIFLGTLVSIFNFKLLAKKTKSIANAATFTGPKVGFLIGGYLFRFLIMAIALWTAINRSFSCFIGAAIGLFMIRLAVYINEAQTYGTKCPDKF